MQTWITVEKHGKKEFNFFNINKQRHSSLFDYNTRFQGPSQLNKHCINLRFDDWHDIEPLNIDKVGNYYRNLKHAKIPGLETRLIFAISLSKENDATKLIKIKTALTVRNNLNYPMQCRVESAINKSLVKQFTIQSETDWSIPLKYIPCKLWFRPFVSSFNYEFSETCIDYSSLNAMKIYNNDYIQMSCQMKHSGSTASIGSHFFFEKL
jgi:hypothetical protein